MLLERFLLIWRIWDLVHVCHHEGSLGYLLPRAHLTTTFNFHSDFVSESFQVCHLFSQQQLSLSGEYPAWFSLYLRILFLSQASKNFGRQWSRGLLKNVSANDPFWSLVKIKTCWHGCLNCIMHLFFKILEYPIIIIDITIFKKVPFYFKTKGTLP